MQDFTLVAKGIYLEGLATDAARDMVWYSDVIAGGVHGVRKNGEVVTLNPERMWTGGVLVNGDGAILSSGAGGILWNHPESGKSGWLIREVDGVPINGVNEMMPDGHGGIYFGTVDLEKIIAGEAVRPATLYRLTVDGKVSVVASGLGFANGIMVSPDNKQLYYNDTFDSTYAFDILADGALGERRHLLKKEDCDGMALDAAGNLWITGFKSSVIVRLAPDGRQLPPVETPAVAITQIRFGGADMRDYYITCVPADAGEMLKAGERPSQPLSLLYRGRSETPGMQIKPPSFQLDNAAEAGAP